MNTQRRLLLAGFVATPIVAVLSACGRKGSWPEGMVEFKWDRDTCSRCSMVISDRRFAVQLRGDKNATFKFDDIGCAVIWMRDKKNTYSWVGESAMQFWVADMTSQGERWLDPRKAYFVGGKTSPMGYNQAAIGYQQAGALSWQDMAQHVLAFEK